MSEQQLQENYGVNWIRSAMKNLPESKQRQMSPFGERVAALLDEWLSGIYHLDRGAWARMEWDHPTDISVTIAGNTLQTYDFSGFTRLIFLAHDQCIRIAIEPVNFHYLRIIFSKRSRDPDAHRMYERHPTLEEAVATHRKHCRLEPVP